MRRSAAPSQLASASKRPRFTPPFASKPSPTNNLTSAVDNVKTHQRSSAGLAPIPAASGQTGGQTAHGKRLVPDVLHLIQQEAGPVEPQPSNVDEDHPPKPQPESNSLQPHAADRFSDVNENSDLGVTCGVVLDTTKPSKATFGHQATTDQRGHSLGSQTGSNGLERSRLQTSQSTNESNSLPAPTAQQTCPGLKPRTVNSHRGTFRQPLLQKNDLPKASRHVPENTGEEVVSHYYNVVWCKLSKKKHKKWEGDAVLVTKGKAVTLLDTEGKEIGKSSGYKTSELSSMTEGHTLRIGGKEIEVMGDISEDDYTSGKCFQSTAPSSLTSAPVQSMPRPAAKPFMNPQKAGSSASGNVKTTPSVRSVPKPLHDPAQTDALVMPRPSAAHQWANNPQHHPVVDVVLDPYLACKLRPHQREGVLFLYECVMGMRGFQGNGAILADDMGLGKTLQCICLIWTLFKQGPYRAKPVIKRVLIVTPGSLVKNWCREFRKWLGNERMQVFPVSADKKVQEFANSPIYPVLVISYEMFVRSIEDIRKVQFDLIVCDEGHRLKNTTIKTTSLVSSLPVQRRVLLTGTPVQNDLQEFHSIVEFCNPGVLGSSGSFHRVYEEPITRGNQPQATAEERKLAATRAAELSRLTGLFVLRRTQEINNQYLPPKVETVVFCKPSNLQLGLYQRLLSSRVLRSCLTASSSLSGTCSSSSSPHLVCIMALKKLCNYPGLLHQACREVAEEQQSEMVLDGILQEESLYKDLLPLFPEDYSPDDVCVRYSGKMQVLASLLRSMHSGGDAPSEKIVVVSNYTQTLSLLQRLCEHEGYRFCRLDGTTPTAKRQEIVEHFNSSYAQETVFLLSSKAGGVGLNLIGASRLLLYDIDWNPANDLQAMARVWRDGQKKQVHIYRLLTTGTIEEKVYQRQISKQGLSGAVVDAKSQGHVKFSLEDLKDLFTLHEGTSCITHDMMACACHSGQPVQGAPQPQTVAQRSCQLGIKTSKDKKNLSMNQLMEWKHFSGPLDETFQDKHLLSAGDQITFVFQNKTNERSSNI